jgi:signal peptidase I
MSKEEKEITKTEEPKTFGAPKSVFREYFESFVVTLIMAIFGMTFVLQAVTVPTGSMQNTILIGDYLLVNKFIFAPSGNPLPFLPQRDIKRGDIIVFKYPGNKVHPENDKGRGIIPYQINYVKRVIGLPGETVEFRNNQVFINGELLSEHRIIADSPTDKYGDPDDQAALQIKSEEPRKDTDGWDVYYSQRTMKAVESGRNLTRPDYEFAVPGKTMVVPDNQFFVMGDARDNSEDSRFWGFVPRELIVGQAMFVYWSCDRAASDGNFFGCLTNPRFNRIGKMIK